MFLSFSICGCNSATGDHTVEPESWSREREVKRELRRWERGNGGAAVANDSYPTRGCR